MRNKQKSHYQAALDELYQDLSGLVDLTKAEFSVLLPYIEIREFDKKVQLIRSGEVEKYFNIVAKGLARKHLPMKNKDVTVQLAVEGHIIHSERSFHSQIPSESVIETIEPTVFLSISYDNLQEVYRRFPKAERLGRLLMSKIFINKDFLYLDQLQKSTRQRFLEYIGTHPHMLQRVPQKYIASYLNIKPETFSRLKHLIKGLKKS